MGAPPTTQERNDNLEALRKAANEWADKELERLDNEVKFMRQVLKGRRGTADNVGTANLASASAVLEGNLNNFITGGGES